MSGDKRFPDRARLLQFVRRVTGKTAKAAQRLLDQVHAGVDAALQHAADYARQHKDAKKFVDRISSVMRAGLGRLQR